MKDSNDKQTQDFCIPKTHGGWRPNAGRKKGTPNKKPKRSATVAIRIPVEILPIVETLKKANSEDRAKIENLVKQTIHD